MANPIFSSFDSSDDLVLLALSKMIMNMVVQAKHKILKVMTKFVHCQTATIGSFAKIRLYYLVMVVFYYKAH